MKKMKALEIGTGPWPIVPIGLYLLGASEIWTSDIVPLLQRDTLRRTIELFCEFRNEGFLGEGWGRCRRSGTIN
jgi:hypothetical protein